MHAHVTTDLNEAYYCAQFCCVVCSLPSTKCLQLLATIILHSLSHSAFLPSPFCVLPISPPLLSMSLPLPCRLIIADLDNSFLHLERCVDYPYGGQDETTGQTPPNPLDSQVAIIFDLNVLSQIANTSKAIIGVRLFIMLTVNINSWGVTQCYMHSLFHTHGEGT